MNSASATTARAANGLASKPHSTPAGPYKGSRATGDGSPVAPPIGPTATGANAQASGPSGPLTVPNVAGSSAASPAPAGPAAEGASARSTSSSSSGSSAGVRRVGRAQRRQHRAELSERDNQILQRVAEHGYLSTAHVQRFVFTDHTSPATAERTARRVLGRLERDRLLASLPRRQGGPLGGSTPMTWQLAPGGARVLREADAGYRSQTPSIRQLLHCLAVADVHLAVLDYTAQTSATAAVQVEPAAWRNYLGLGGERRTLKGDLYARIDGSDQDGAYRDDWVIEVDRGTESMPTLLGKCQQYATYHQSGAWSDHGPAMPLVLWVLPDRKRAERLAIAVQRRAGGRLPTELFRFATLNTVADVLANPDPGGGGTS